MPNRASTLRCARTTRQLSTNEFSSDSTHRCYDRVVRFALHVPVVNKFKWSFVERNHVNVAPSNAYRYQCRPCKPYLVVGGTLCAYVRRDPASPVLRRTVHMKELGETLKAEYLIRRAGPPTASAEKGLLEGHRRLKQCDSWQPRMPHNMQVQRQVVNSLILMCQACKGTRSSAALGSVSAHSNAEVANSLALPPAQDHAHQSAE